MSQNCPEAFSHQSLLFLFFLYRRNMGGGPFPYRLGVTKNKFVEEWNGRREITEKAFEANGRTITWILTLCVAAPYALYLVARDELQTVHPRRYKNLC